MSALLEPVVVLILHTAFVPFPELRQCPCISELIAWWAGSTRERLSLAVFPPLESEEVLLLPCAAASFVEADHDKDWS